MRIANTRPLNAEDPFSLALKQAGHQVVSGPLSSIEFLDISADQQSQLIAQSIDAIIVSSQNSLRSIARFPDLLNPLKGVPLFAVGETTAAYARTLGWTRITVGKGGMKALLPLVYNADFDQEARFFYPSAQITSFDVKPSMQARGFQLLQVTVYKTLYPAELPAAFCNRENFSDLQAIAFFAKGSSEHFVKLVQEKFGTDPRRLAFLKSIQAWCFSQEIERTISHLPWLETQVASKPSLAHIVELANI